MLTLRSNPLRLFIPRNVPGITSPMWFLLKSMYSREESERRSTSLIVWKGEERGFEMPEIPRHQKWILGDTSGQLKPPVSYVWGVPADSGPLLLLPSALLWN